MRRAKWRAALMLPSLQLRPRARAAPSIARTGPPRMQSSRSYKRPRSRARSRASCHRRSRRSSARSAVPGTARASTGAVCVPSASPATSASSRAAPTARAVACACEASARALPGMPAPSAPKLSRCVLRAASTTARGAAFAERARVSASRVGAVLTVPRLWRARPTACAPATARASRASASAPSASAASTAALR